MGPMTRKLSMHMLHGLRSRIMLPSAVFILVFSLLFIGLNNYYTSRLMDSRLERESVRISGILSEAEFLLNPVYLKRLGKVIEGKVLLFDNTGTIISSSWDVGEEMPVLSLADRVVLWKTMENDAPSMVLKKLRRHERVYLLAVKKTEQDQGDGGKLMAIITPLDDLEDAKRDAALKTLYSGLIALILAFAGAGAFAKKMTRSVDELAETTRIIAAGDFTARARIPNTSELQTLALSINTMSERLSTYKKELVDATRFDSAGKIIAAVAHEIRNPLSSMQMLAQLVLKRHGRDRKSVSLINSLLEEIHRVERLVSDLASVSGPEKLHLAPHDPMDILTELLKVVTPRLAHLGVVLKTDGEYDGQGIMMDKDRVRQVLWNLIMNGAESMPQGGELCVSLGCEPGEGMIFFVVRDYGCGISRDMVDTLFVPFVSTKQEGMGLGLYISRTIARAHGGDLRIIPKKCGVEAVFSLPVERV